MRLYLVRHAQTAWNFDGKAQGHTDISLDPIGLDQAAKIGDVFQDYPVDLVLSSDLSRAKQTAEPIAIVSGASLELRTDLRERTFGAWEGLPFAEVSANLAERASAKGISPQEVRPPNGESYLDVWTRLDDVIETIRNFDGDLVVVSHGGTLSLLLAKLVLGTLDTSRSFRFGNTGVTELELARDGLFRIIRYNDTNHLVAARPLSGSLDGTHR